MDLQRRHVHANRHLHLERPLIAAALGLVICAAPASAQISVEVSPLRVELTAGPGSTSTQPITLTNAGKEPVRVRAILTDWDLSRDGVPQFESAEQNGTFSATTWVRLAPPEIVIEPAKEAAVRFSLAVPADVQPGGYRTGVLFEFGPATGDPAARAREVQFKSRIATLIYVNVGQPPMAAELTDLRQLTAGGQVQIVATLKNTSRRSVRTKGTLIIYDASGKTLREMPVPDVPLLPESERDVAILAIDAEENLTLPAGEYRVEVKLDVGLPALVVGETTLKVPR